DDIVGLTALASCYEMLQNFNDALNLYNRALSTDKKNAYLLSAIERTEKNTDFSRPSVMSEPMPLDTDILQNDLSYQNDIENDVDVNFDSVHASQNPYTEEIIPEEVPIDDPQMDEPQTEEEIFFDFDKIDSAFSKREDVYDPLELEPIDLEPIEEDNLGLDSLAFDGAPVDYEPMNKRNAFDEDVEEDYHDSSNNVNGISFDDEELELPSCDDLEAKKDMGIDVPFNPVPQSMKPSSMGMPSSMAENKAQSAESMKESQTDSVKEAEPVKVLSNIVTNDILHRIPEILRNLIDNKLAQQCDSTAELFRHMKSMCNYLPPLQKEAFLSGKKHMQMDYIIDRLTGRPGLLATAEELRRNGLVQIPESRYDIVQKFDESATTGRVLSSMRSFIHQLPDKNIATALDNAVIDVLERLAVKKLYEPE
ncbi:MAG: hypothetical protein IKZ04_05035, partial [Spirochaetaceae bacterium]|nr:hypothetical protein [Spirochaetaceae bacterium]